MRIFPGLIATLFLLFTYGATSAQTTEENHQTFRDIINAQIKAFRDNRPSAAFSFAAPQLQAQIGSAAKFNKMVRDTYPPIYLPREYMFGAVTNELLNGPTQRVTIIGPHNGIWQALYGFQRHDDGGWRIAGVELKSMAAVGGAKPEAEGDHLISGLTSSVDGSKFIVLYDKKTKQVSITRITGKQPKNKDVELWIIAGGNPPVSLGLVGGSGTKAPAVPAKVQAAFETGATLALSIEPVGGSTTGAPTGPVIAQAPVKQTVIN